MGKKMLIDAAHREETRVAIVSGNRVENFDFESEAKRPLRGNIYLAKVTRVEPSLQAAFIEYGGNRHGFLAFSEIHPDYYQIPVADRERLLAEEAAEAEAYDDDDVDLDDEDDDDIEAAADSDDDDSDDDEDDTGEAYDIGLNAFDADAEGDAEDDTDDDS
jgi:ribonuclease E